MPPSKALRYLLTLGATCALLSCATAPAPSAKLDTMTKTVLSAMSEKLAAAKTLRVSMTRTASPGFNTGMTVAESARGTIMVSRPNKLAAYLKTSEGARSFGFDGSHLTVVDHAAGTHAIVKAKGDIDSAVRSIQRIYGLTPPVAELLVNDPRAVLLEGVKSGKHVGTESIFGVACDHLTFQQDGLSWQLWVARDDKLPRRISMAYPNGEGGAPLIMTATMSQWELDGPVSAANLTVKAPASSRELEMIPLSN